MKQFIMAFIMAFFAKAAMAQQKVQIQFKNDYADVYHLSLIVYLPDSTGQTRVSNLQPGETKQYNWPVGTAIYIANYRQEAFAMQGNDVRALGLQPYWVLQPGDDKRVLKLSALAPKPGGR
jgi:hypothetical protein